MWYQQYVDIWSEIGSCLIRCKHLDCQYAGLRRRHPLWKRFPLRALFPHLNLGRPTEIDYRIQEKLKEYVHKLMLPVEDWDKEEIVPQIDSVLNRTKGVPCSKCWTGQDPGFTRFWTYIYGDRILPNPKSVQVHGHMGDNNDDPENTKIHE